MSESHDLFGFGREVLERLDTIIRKLDQLLSREPDGSEEFEDRSAPQLATSSGAASEDHPPERDNPRKEPNPSKNRVSDKMFAEKAPAMLLLLLREGNRTTGMRTPTLASELDISKDSVARIAVRLAEETNLVHIVPNSGRGGRGSIVRIVGRKHEEAASWAAGKSTL